MRQPLLREENIVTALDAGNQEEALRKLIDHVPAWRLDKTARSRILNLLALRERLGTTAIGRGIALPHCFSPDISKPFILFGLSHHGIPYGALDGDLVHFIFLLILPQNDAAERTKRELLQNIKWFLCDRYLQSQLKTARSADEVMALLTPTAKPGSVFQQSH